MTQAARPTVATIIRDALTVLCLPDQVVELRIPKIDGKRRTDSGYFNDFDKLATIAARYDGRAGGVYFTLNPVEPALLARAENRIREWADLTTSDDHIVRRRWLPIDCDPKVNGRKRPAGISSTEEEHSAAIGKAEAIREWLTVAGWPDPIVADSGNGGALLYAVDLPNDDAGRDLIEGCLKSLAAEFDDETADIDTSVFNAARIWKLYGTLAGKGDSTKDRPHRRAGLITIPDRVKPVSIALLRTLTKRLEKSEPATRSTANGITLHAGEWLKKHGIAIAHEKPGKNNSTVYTLEACPFNSDHIAPDACVIQHQSGALVFKCLHSSCQQYNWQALREKMEQGVYDRRNGTAPLKSGNGRKHSAMITSALQSLGYTFALNLCNNAVEVNGDPIDDILRARIRTDARDAGLKPLDSIEDIYTVEALNHAYHPVQDYLNGLQWDGERHITRLAAAFECTDPLVVYPDGQQLTLIHVYLWRWLIGACAKALGGEQNLMLVLAGPQGTGKSSFARWLCRNLPAYFIEAPINPNDKDTDVRLMSYFLWEVSELDATTRKADVSALKAFITKKIVAVRKAYGHHDTVKPALASLIGTVNESSGFLSDDTGNRRFMVATISAIDWGYTHKIDINQVWAEAVAAYRGGEPWALAGCELAAQTEQNRQHEVESLLESYIEQHFDVSRAANGARMTAAEIVDHLRLQHDIRLSGSERAQAMELSRILKHLGVRKIRTGLWRGYEGIQTK